MGGSSGSSVNKGATSITDGTSANSNTTNDTKTSTPTKSTNTSTSTNSTSTTNKTGGYFIVSEGEHIKEGTLNTTDFTSVTIDGKKIQLRYPGTYAGTWSNIDDTSSCCGKYTDVILGSYDKNDHYMFYYGNSTKDMPQAGIANYVGESLYGTVNLDDDYFGNATLTANFADKTLAGKLKNKVSTIDVKANISGNQFTGTAKSSIDTAVADVNGGFYGVNAKELAGLALAKDGNGKGQWGVGFIAGKK